MAINPVFAKTWTLDADFQEGTLNNLILDPHDQLQLPAQTTAPFPFVNVACSARGTIVRIDVTTGVILGEYWTAPYGMGRNPSRTTVDQRGNVWVTNRDEIGYVGDTRKGSITRIGLIIGGTRCDADGSPNPSGQYLKPPFAYNTCIDKDGDGLIKTSRGLGNILDWTNAGNADAYGGVTTADDEAVLNYTRVAGTGARTVAIDRDNNLWVGGLNNSAHEKLDGLTGQPVPGTQLNYGCGGYGGLIDGNGVLWSARGPSGLLRYDPATSTGTCLNFSDGYGLGVDPATGHIWHATLSLSAVYEIDPNGTLLNTYGHGTQYAQGVAVDNAGNVWVAGSLYDHYTGHLRTDGTFIGNVYTPNGPTGVAVDANGKVWVTCYYGSQVMRIDPNAGPIVNGYHVGEVDLTIDLGLGAGPYNYSDMTGFVAVGTTSPQGTWTVTYDSGIAGDMWTRIDWNEAIAANTAIAVSVRAAESQADLASQPFTTVGNGAALSGLTGRYLEVQATLSRDPQVAESPVLYDLTAHFRTPNDAPLANAGGPYVAECTGLTTALLLDGSASSDPDGDVLTYAWTSTCPGATFDNPALAQPVLTLDTSCDCAIDCSVLLTVSDGEYADTASALVHVGDTQAPAVVARSTPFVLWPPNHQYVTVTPGDLLASASDGCDASLTLASATVVSVTSDEPEDAIGNGDGKTLSDILITCPNAVQLRAEREGTGNGRVYTITYLFVDKAGNETTIDVTVGVPHSQDGVAAVAGPGPGYTVTGCAEKQESRVASGAASARSDETAAADRLVRFTLPRPARVTLDVFDIQGRLLRRVSEFRSAGPQSFAWDGRDALGRLVPVGVYLYSVRTPDAVLGGRVLRMR